MNQGNGIGMVVSGLGVSIAWASVDSPATGAVARVPRLMAVVIPLVSVAMFTFANWLIS